MNVAQIRITPYKRAVVADGMSLLQQSAMANVITGETSREEALSLCVNRPTQFWLRLPTRLPRTVLAVAIGWLTTLTASFRIGTSRSRDQQSLKTGLGPPNLADRLGKLGEEKELLDFYRFPTMPML